MISKCEEWPKPSEVCDTCLNVPCICKEQDSPAEPPAWSSTLTDEEWDFLDGTTCNPDAPEECESCQ